MVSYDENVKETGVGERYFGPAEAGAPAWDDQVIAGTLSDRIFRALSARIVSGRLAPGTSLRVRDLAAEVGTSIMPVRDAIRSLVECGLAEQEPYKSARVRGLDPVELESSYAARSLIEGECARLGTLAADDALVEQLEDAWEGLRTAQDRADVPIILRYDEELLDILYRRSGNQVLLDIVHTMWEKYRPYKALWVSSMLDGDSGIGWMHGDVLIDAVRRRDSEAARDAMVSWYRDAGDVVRSILGMRSHGD